MRDKDANTAWATAAADGVLEERRCYCQNWRGDVSAIVTDAGKMVEWVKYSAYGIPMGLPCGDNDSDGDWDATDSGNSGGSYDIREDTEMDDDVDAADVTYANSITGGYQTLGRTVMTSASVANRKGYAGYENDGSIWRLDHVRYRALHKEFGRWPQRDPMGYADGMSRYEYVRSNGIGASDPSGLIPYLQMGSPKIHQLAPVDPPNTQNCASSHPGNHGACQECCNEQFPDLNDANFLSCLSACFNPYYYPPDWWGDCDEDQEIKYDENGIPLDIDYGTSRGNCLRYALACPGTPGTSDAHQDTIAGFGYGTCGCAALMAALNNAGLKVDTGGCPGWLVRVFTQEADEFGGCEYHFTRQDPDGGWSEKRGCDDVQPAKCVPGNCPSGNGSLDHCGDICVTGPTCIAAQ